MMIECEGMVETGHGSNGFDLAVIRCVLYRARFDAADMHDAADRFAHQAYGLHPERIGGIAIQAYCLACRCPLTGSLQHDCRSLACIRRPARPPHARVTRHYSS